MLFIVFITGLVFFLLVVFIKFGILVPLKKQKYPHISLTVGVPYQLSCGQENLSWSSENPSVSINASGVVTVSKDKLFPDGQGIIHGFSNKSKSTVCSYTFTIVPWTANESKIEILEVNSMIEIFGYKIQYPIVRLSTQFILPSMVVHANMDGWIYYSINKKLYKTQNNFKSRKKVSNLPFRPGKQRMIITPFGYFMRGKEGVYYSKDFGSWELSLKTNHPAWLLDNMDHWYDKENQKAYIYVSEYSVIIGEDHYLYRGIIDTSKKPKWNIAFTLLSDVKLKQDSRNFAQAARHIHLIKVDHFTGDVYFGTGDHDSHAMIRKSADNGKTFQLMGLGSQEYRTLGIWFTENYIYWNMDKTFPDQMIFRAKRSHLEENGSLTPILKSGKTKIGVDYFVYSQNLNNYFPKKQGEKFTETIERQLSEENQLLALSDPNFDKKELVANLTNGSHWSVFDAKTSDGKIVTLLTTTSEGFHRYKTRDNLGRIFGIQEDKSGSVIVSELLTIAPYDSKTEKARIEAIAQADDGTIYFQSFHSLFGGSVVAGSLQWNITEKTEFKEHNLVLN